MRKILSFQVILTLLLAFSSVPARADLYAAWQAYQQKDYPSAFVMFRELAELGQLTAQEQIAVMYVDAEGVPRNNVLGYAWASIAVENGSTSVQSIIDQLEKHITLPARQRIDAVRAQFGAEALRKRILPNIFDRSMLADYKPCKMAKAASASYPIEAQNAGIEGSVYLEFMVMPDGRARNPRIIYSLPVKTFDRAARAVVLKTEFSPATTKNVPEPCSMALMVRYTMHQNETEFPKLMSLVKETKTKADGGDARAQMLYGFLVEGLPQLAKSRSEAMPAILKAAQAGLSTAQFMIGYRALQGWGCECDEPKALVWLHKAAANDQADAQVVLAHYLLRGEPAAEQVAQARVWLERAAAKRSEEGKYYLAALLAASKEAGQRDPERALVLLGEVMRDRTMDPTAFEIRAAAQAMLGKFGAAKKDQEQALKMAQKLGWETASQQQRLTAYNKGEPWIGDLLAF